MRGTGTITATILQRAVWFGKDSDPAGPVPATDAPEVAAAYAGLTLAARKGERARGETV